MEIIKIVAIANIEWNARGMVVDLCVQNDNVSINCVTRIIMLLLQTWKWELVKW